MDSLQSFSLAPFQLVRPEKVRWFFPTGLSTPLEGIKSKSLIKFVKKTSGLLQKNAITVDFTELTAPDFLTFLKFYREKMSEQEKDILVDETWFDKKRAEQKKVYRWFYTQHNQLIGTSIAIEHEDTFIHAFKASERITVSSESHSSFGSIMEYLFLEKAYELNKKIISSGSSRNAFGAVNSLGYLESKLAFGYIPSPNEGTSFETNISKKPGTPVVFWCGKDAATQDHFCAIMDDENEKSKTQFISNYGFPTEIILAKAD